YSEIVRNKTSVKKDDYFFVLNNKKALAKEYNERLEIEILNLSAKTINLNFKDNNARKARDVLDAIIRSFEEYSVSKKKQASKQILQFLDRQIENVFEKQKFSETAMQNYRKENNISSNADYSGLFIEKLNQLDNSAISMEVQLSVLNQVLAEVEKQGSDIDIYHLMPILLTAEF